MIDEKELIENIKTLKSQTDMFVRNIVHYTPTKCDNVDEIINNCKSIRNEISVFERAYNQPKVREWIPCSERLPEEHESIFAKLKGTSLWDNAMIEKYSDDVNVTVELSDGKRITATSHTIDGKWKEEKKLSIVKKKVIAWMPLPEPYKESKADG